MLKNGTETEKKQVNKYFKKKNKKIKQKQANKVMPILKNHHLLLSTLLVANAFAMEALPIFLHEIVPAAYSVLISTIVVVIFGEILP